MSPSFSPAVHPPITLQIPVIVVLTPNKLPQRQTCRLDYAGCTHRFLSFCLALQDKCQHNTLERATINFFASIPNNRTQIFTYLASDLRFLWRYNDYDLLECDAVQFSGFFYLQKEAADSSHLANYTASQSRRS